MKKLLSILLAVAMLTTLAVATVTVRPGTKLEFPMFGTGELGTSDEGIKIENTSGPNSWSGTKDYNGTNFTVSSVKWTKGSDLVKSVTIDGDGYLVIALKENYTLLESKGKTIAGTFRITEKGKSTANNYEVGTGAATEVIVGYKDELIFLDTSPTLGYPDDETVYEAVKENNVSYATVSFSDALGNDINVRMYAEEKFYLASNGNANLDIVKKYDDTNATLDFINFPARPTFSSSATYYIYAEKDEYIYAIQDGKLVASGAKWDNDEGCWTLKTRTLGSYVISDKKLSVASSTTGTTTGNTVTTSPDTGANDVVGIAAALAAVALISAAAVSLKK